MFSRISQLGKNISGEFESAVKPTRPHVDTGSAKDYGDLDSPNGNGSRSSTPRLRKRFSLQLGTSQRAVSTPITSALETLKGNASLLNHKTPDPAFLDAELKQLGFELNSSEEDESDIEDATPLKESEKIVQGDTAIQGEKKPDKAILSKLHKLDKYENKYPGE